jgi:hypothetical protein
MVKQCTHCGTLVPGNNLLFHQTFDCPPEHLRHVQQQPVQQQYVQQQQHIQQQQQQQQRDSIDMSDSPPPSILATATVTPPFEDFTSHESSPTSAATARLIQYDDDDDDDEDDDDDDDDEDDDDDDDDDHEDDEDDDDDDHEDDDDDDHEDDLSLPQNISNQWSCSNCTHLNATTNTTCEICHHPNPVQRGTTTTTTTLSTLTGARQRNRPDVPFLIFPPTSTFTFTVGENQLPVDMVASARTSTATGMPGYPSSYSNAAAAVTGAAVTGAAGSDGDIPMASQGNGSRPRPSIRMEQHTWQQNGDRDRDRDQQVTTIHRNTGTTRIVRRRPNTPTASARHHQQQHNLQQQFQQIRQHQQQQLLLERQQLRQVRQQLRQQRQQQQQQLLLERQQLRQVRQQLRQQRQQEQHLQRQLLQELHHLQQQFQQQEQHLQQQFQLGAAEEQLFLLLQNRISANANLTAAEGGGVGVGMEDIHHSLHDGYSVAAAAAAAAGRPDTVDDMNYEQLLRAFGNGTENMGADETIISQLPFHTLKDPIKELPSDARRCNICLEDFVKDEVRLCLPCFHGFHENCCKTWLRQNGKCPLCQHRVEDGI